MERPPSQSTAVLWSPQSIGAAAEGRISLAMGLKRRHAVGRLRAKTQEMGQNSWLSQNGRGPWWSGLFHREVRTGPSGPVRFCPRRLVPGEGRFQDAEPPGKEVRGREPGPATLLALAGRRRRSRRPTSGGREVPKLSTAHRKKVPEIAPTRRRDLVREGNDRCKSTLVVRLSERICPEARRPSKAILRSRSLSEGNAASGQRRRSNRVPFCGGRY